AGDGRQSGARVAGKPRHSDRYLDDLLRGLGKPVKSLTPKLAGRTQLRAADAGVLVHLFLSHWDYSGDPNSSEIGVRSAESYKPLLADAEIEAVCGYVENRIFSVGPEARNGIESAAESSLPGQDMNDLIAAEFQKSVALFIVGAGQSLLVPRSELTLVLFRDGVNRLWALDE